MITIAVMLASAQVMPSIDRNWLEAQARREQVKRISAPAAAKPRPVSASDALRTNMEAVSAVCDAAATSDDGAAFLTRLGTAFQMPRGEVAALRERCALYLLGARDARRKANAATKR